MTTTLTIAELEQAEGLDLGAGEWQDVTQEQVNLFADATGDHQWIHVDPEAAAKGPFGRTIAHGYLTLSLLPVLLGDLIHVSDAKLGVNYGTEKIRFPSPVPVGSRVRLHAVVRSAQRREIGVIYTVGVTVEVEGQEKPALVGEVVYLAG
jgi:acyl dehydratase